MQCLCYACHILPSIQVLLRSLVLTLESPALCSLKTESDSSVGTSSSDAATTASATASYLGTSWMDVRAVPLPQATKLQSTDEIDATTATTAAGTDSTKQSTAAAATVEQVQELAAAWQARQQSAEAAAAAAAAADDGASQQQLPHQQLQKRLLKYLSCSAPAAAAAAAAAAATTAAAAASTAAAAAGVDHTDNSSSSSTTESAAAATPTAAPEAGWVLCNESEAPPGLSRLHQYLQQNLAGIVRDCMAVVDLRNIDHENICTLNTVLALLVLARARGGDSALARVLAAVRSGTTTAARHVPRADVHSTDCIPTAEAATDSSASASIGPVRTGSEVSIAASIDIHIIL
jgi:trimeric autotransporter adhesin